MDIKLTQYSHGAGCGCKISPEVLSQILDFAGPRMAHPHLCRQSNKVLPFMKLIMTMWSSVRLTFHANR